MTRRECEELVPITASPQIRAGMLLQWGPCTKCGRQHRFLAMGKDSQPKQGFCGTHGPLVERCVLWLIEPCPHWSRNTLGFCLQAGIDRRELFEVRSRREDEDRHERAADLDRLAAAKLARMDAPEKERPR